MEQEITNIQDIIDLSIVEFIEFIMSNTFSYNNSMSKLLDVELVRVQLLRHAVYTDMEQARLSENLSDYDTFRRNFVSTFIQEQRILDRLEIIKEKLKSSGIKL